MENLSLNEYQRQTRTTAIYPKENLPIYPVLGLNGEAGEVADKLKKIIRDKEGVMSDEDKTELAKEVGDILWYVSQIASDLGYNLEDVARMNLAKLFSRKERGALGGSGDNR